LFSLGLTFILWKMEDDGTASNGREPGARHQPEFGRIRQHRDGCFDLSKESALLHDRSRQFIDAQEIIPSANRFE
jgi:hypothetical protein